MAFQNLEAEWHKQVSSESERDQEITTGYRLLSNGTPLAKFTNLNIGNTLQNMVSGIRPTLKFQ